MMRARPTAAAAVTARSAAFAVLAASTACSMTPGVRPMPTQPEWDVARAWLSDLRAGEPAQPFGAVVQVTLREPHSGRTFSARGAVAIDPHRAFRMILVGPGGATALDVWGTRDAWRFEVPAAHVLRHGGREDDPSLPIGFFRWWFLAPLSGRLLTAWPTPRPTASASSCATASPRWTSRTSAVPRGHAVTAARLVEGREAAVDRVDFQGASFAVALASGDRAVYDRPLRASRRGRRRVALGAPDPAAFVDPDRPAFRPPPTGMP